MRIFHYQGHIAQAFGNNFHDQRLKKPWSKKIPQGLSTYRHNIIKSL